MCKKRSCLIAGAVVSGLVAILGGILIPIGDSIIEGTVRKEVVIENGTIAYETWAGTVGSVYRQFWVFDVQNPEEIIKNGSKPIVVEKGPYTYRTRYLPKANITENNNNTISFLLPNGAIFEPSLSIGSEDDKIMSLNLGLAGAYSLIKPSEHFVLNILIKNTNSSLFQHRSVKEILWGYKDPLLLNSTTGLFVPYNGTFDGYYNVFTGKDDISKTAIIDKWRGESHVSFWNNTYCNMINGTDGASFPPFLDKKTPLYFFSSDICRSVSAEYEGTKDLKGITVYRFMLPSKTFASPTVNADNRCYCSNDSPVDKNCTLAGVLNVSPCRDGMPVFISLPHFLYGSKSLSEAIDGISPDEDHHSTFLDVEPITGFSMRFAKRLQVNLAYGPSKTIDVLKNIKEHIVFPVVWLNETAALDDASAEEFKASLTSRVEMLENVQMSLIGIGCVLFLGFAISLCVLSRSDGFKA
ncbi:platelet glycoprotein 4 [Amia ocellicauda]|uniref:platelet glycoprotein 4 n=1 Tax=Amia ocellicauda TaxID=2972642 RepID=UPI003463A1D4